MPHGGRLVIETQNVDLGEEYTRLYSYVRAGRHVRLAVSDNGVGMDAATREHIFEPFFTTKEPGKGTGLGLATVYGVVKQHGGFVHVYSELGRGSTFHVYLPVSDRGLLEERRKEKTVAAPVRGGGETILVAEDHDGLREMARATLEGLGYQVKLARDGEEAIQVFQAHGEEIALALLDVVMPKLAGPQLYARLSAAKPDLPVILTTGYSAQSASLSALLEKGVPVLQKPYTPSQLGRRVREALDRAAPVAAVGPASSSRKRLQTP
jgi:CheY-like chemotaxis protein